ERIHPHGPTGMFPTPVRKSAIGKSDGPAQQPLADRTRRLDMVRSGTDAVKRAENQRAAPVAAILSDDVAVCAIGPTRVGFPLRIVILAITGSVMVVEPAQRPIRHLRVIKGASGTRQSGRNKDVFPPCVMRRR